ncbi:hypothetical protein [Geomicrobium sp. JCM 19039]|uniref:hypothetical protein n=1 Tax=Geomicrobium sp. JCM 19039 TaxID=1460636 RepID=UPI000A8A22FA|nr:hypothetical protein [Geomicrobium sp. JCM 19039]
MKVITLCGSTKFKEQFEQAERALTLEGHAVISVGFFEQSEGIEITDEQVQMFGQIHFKKIDLADEIFVIDPGGTSERRHVKKLTMHTAMKRPFSITQKVGWTMIRRLTQADHEECFALLKTKAAENLFIIGDIEAFGYEQDFQRLWGEWDERGELIAVLLKYRQNYIPFAVAPFDALAFSEIMLEDSEFHMMSGLKETTEKIEPYLGAYKRKRETYYAKCTTVKNDFRDVSVVERATEADAEPIVNLLNSIPEFDQSVDVTASDKRKDERWCITLSIRTSWRTNRLDSFNSCRKYRLSHDHCSRHTCRL